MRHGIPISLQVWALIIGGNALSMKMDFKSLNKNHLKCFWEITTHIRKYGGNYSGEILATLQGIIEVREFQLAEGGIYERHKNALNERIERIAIGMLQAAFSFQNRDAFNFASKRLNFWRLTSGLKLRVLIFKLPDALLRPIFSAVRFVKE